MCQKCGGRVITERDKYGTSRLCLICGTSKDIPNDESVPLKYYRPSNYVAQVRALEAYQNSK